VSLAPRDDTRALAPVLARIDLVVLHFEKAGDGRAFTQARILREQLDYRGAIRAVGAVTLDQLGFMFRCGIDEVIFRDPHEEPFALAALDRFTVRYQGASDEREPLYRRMAR
jgi:uncharacterized protein (DUF934 family)